MNEKTIIEKIENLAKKIYEEFESGSPSIEFIVRGSLKNIEYDVGRDIIKLKLKRV